jgi:predicted dehydrogenase
MLVAAFPPGVPALFLPLIRQEPAMSVSRRTFLQTAAAAGALTPYWFSTARTQGDETKAANDRPGVGCIGNGGMGRGDANAISQFGDILALCDVDRSHSEAFKKDPKLGAKNPEIYEDYRKLLDRKDIQLVTISTPDHWHTRIAIDALRAGKDVHCQKPLTLTIDEGKLLCSVVKETGRVMQVGTQQRSDDKFLKAVALARSGRIGKITRVTCAIGGSPRGKTFAKTKPPASLNWDMWLGQAPLVDFINERCHSNFRWWYEYSGGKLTDWGAHHVDIGQWGIGMENSGPTSVEVLSVNHPVPFEKGWPTIDNTYNAAVTFNVRCLFPNGVEMFIRDRADDLGFENGVMFEGEKGRFFVNRGKLTGEAVDDLAKNPLSETLLSELRKGKSRESHMANFIACTRDRSLPISDVYSHHRNLTTCHLANISMRFGRKLTWNSQTEQIEGDDEARAFQRREQRKGYEVA